MQLEHLRLDHFRNYAHCDVTFGGGLNLFYGNNAQGKTSLLEAIYLCITGGSNRTAGLAPLIQEQRGAFHLEARFLKDRLPIDLTIHYDGQTRTMSHGTTRLTRIAELLELVPGILLTPEDIALAYGPPRGRRQFLDLHIAKGNRRYIYQLGRYQRAVRQRNTLLRLGHTAPSTTHLASIFTPWEEEMALSAFYITKCRLEAIESLSSRANFHLQQLTNQAHQLELVLHTNVAVKKETLPNWQKCFTDQLARNRFTDYQLGYTSKGPHRDDIAISIDQHPARLFASQGQLYACAAALRLAQWNHLAIATRVPPLMMIDDLGIGLDMEKRHRLLELTSSLEYDGKAAQVIITTADKLPPPTSRTKFQPYSVHGGEIRPDGRQDTLLEAAPKKSPLSIPTRCPTQHPRSADQTE